MEIIRAPQADALLPSPGRSQKTFPMRDGWSLPVVRAGSRDLCRRQELPDGAGVLHLEDAAFVRVEKVFSVGDAVGIRRPHRATSPASRAHAAPVFLIVHGQVDSIFYPILDTRPECRYQPSYSLTLLCGHNVWMLNESLRFDRKYYGDSTTKMAPKYALFSVFLPV